MNNTAGPILVVSLPEAGLLNPLLVLTAELSRRGVPGLCFATDEPRREQVAACAVDAPVEFVSLGDVIPEMSAVSWDDDVYRQVTQASRFRAHRATIRQTFRPALQAPKYRALEAAVDRIRPELMVIDCKAAFAVDLAITKRIPYVLSVPFLASNVLASHHPFGRSYVPRGFPVPNSGLPFDMSPGQRIGNALFRWRTLGMFMNPAMGKVLREDAAYRKELGITAKPNPTAAVDQAERILCYSVPELDYPFTIPDKVRMVGAMVPPVPEPVPGGDDVEDWLDARPSVVYMGFGTITRLTREEVAALVEVARRLEKRGHHVLWKLPEEQRHLLPPAAELSDNLRIESWVPSQYNVLGHPNVKVFFTHAGSNGFHEGLYFGKPQVARPLWADCYDEAVRGEDHGVSLTLDAPRTIDPHDATDKLLRVLEEPSFRERAERIGLIQRTAGGRKAAADLLLDLLPKPAGPASPDSVPQPG
ncbi:glycosyltransferase [Actinomadura welshii]